MTERYQIGRPFGSFDRGQSRDGERLALLDLTALDPPKSGSFHLDVSFGDRGPARYGFVAHIHHPYAAGFVKMGKTLHGLFLLGKPYAEGGVVYLRLDCAAELAA